jgi:hypothetical protein
MNDDTMTMENVERQIAQYHTCYVGNGMCAPFNRDVLRGWLRELGLTGDQITAFFATHGIPLPG